MKRLRPIFLLSILIALASFGVVGYLMFFGPDRLEFSGKDLPQLIADGVAVTGFKRLGDEPGVGWRGGCVFLLQPLGHFESCESDWHTIWVAILIWPAPAASRRPMRARIFAGAPTRERGDFS